jgi:arginyl-tRNA synthetase
MEERIREAVGKALEELGASGVQFAVERPADLMHGDYATNAAMAAAKQLGRNPRELAEEIAKHIEKNLGTSTNSVQVAGPGFVNITLAHEAVSKIIEGAKEPDFAKASSGEERRVMLEYGNPNPFKEMHIGHLMGAIIGEAVSRLMEAEGTEVLRDSFGGDVGPHVAKALWALRQKGVMDVASPKEIGEAYMHGSNAYEESEKAKAEIDELNTNLYAVVALADTSQELSSDDQTLLQLWRKGREISMEEFARIFTLLGTKFDYIFYDSDTIVPGTEAVQSALEKGIFEKSEGAVIYRGEKKGLHTLVFITSRGTPTYETKDVGLALMKEERAATDEVIIVTGAEQIGHFKVFLAALEEIAPLIAKKTKHVPHGLLELTTGKMSSRKGNVITGAALIQEITERASEKNPDPVIAEQVAIGAIKYMVLRQAPGQDIIFDPEKSLSLEGDSGPYLQYAYVRAAKILAYAENGEGGTESPAMPYEIERIIIHYPEIVARAASDRAPQLLVQYLTELAGAWNSFYAREQVLGSPEEQYKQRVARAFANTMKHGLTLLGIPVPERM